MAKDSILNIILNIVKQGSGAEDTKNDLGGLDDQLSSLGNSILGDVVGFTSLAGAAYAVFDELKQDIGAATEAETTMARLGATVQSTGRSGDISSAQIHNMAESMRGLFSTEDIENAANTLMRFMDIPTNQIPGDLVLLQNMAAAMGGTVSDAANTLGMALETGRTRGLGFSRELTSEIATMMTQGDIAGADAIIMDQLNSKFSGQSAAALDTYAGKQAVVSNDWKEMGISIGDYFLPALKTADDWLIKGFDSENLYSRAQADGVNISRDFWTGQTTVNGVLVTQAQLLDDITAVENGTGDAYTVTTQKIQDLEDETASYNATLDQLKADGQEGSQTFIQYTHYVQVAKDEINALKGTTHDASIVLQDEYYASARAAANATEDLAMKALKDAAALKEQTAESNFLNTALDTITTSDEKISGIEADLATARKEGYSENGQHITDLKNKLQDAQEAERVSMMKMVDQWVYTNTVMGSKDPKVFQQYLDMEVAQGLITAAEETSALGWLDYAKTVMDNPINGEVHVHTIFDDPRWGGASPNQGQATLPKGSDLTPPENRGVGGPVEPNSYIWNESASSRPEVFVSGGGRILTKQDAQEALGGDTIILNYSTMFSMLSFADEAKFEQVMYPIIDRMIQRSKGRG